MNFDPETNYLSFNDVLLVPKKSKIKSRSDIDLSSILGNPRNPEGFIRLEIPIILAPMQFISSDEMISRVIDRGGIAFVQRWQAKEKRIEQLNSLIKKIPYTRRLGFAVGIEEAKDKDFINNLIEANVTLILIDTAFGHTDTCIEAVRQLRSIVPNNVHIMSGNVSSYEAYKDLMDAGCDSVRVGIGGGAACITRMVTGFGVPVLGSLINVFNGVSQDKVNGIISDGAIEDSGSMVKALAAGASAVMIGKMFSGHDECDKHEGRFVYRGIASHESQVYMGIGDKELYNLHVEGIAGIVNQKGKVDYKINELVNNTQSGLSYCGSQNLVDFRNECNFIKVSVQTVKESLGRL